MKLNQKKQQLTADFLKCTYEPPHDNTNKVSVRPERTRISLGICPVWSESSLSAWRNFGPLATHWAHSRDSDQTGRMPRLIWVFAGRTLILFVLSRGGSYLYHSYACRTCVLRILGTVKHNIHITCNSASSRENLSSGFETRVDSNRPAQPQKQSRGLKLHIKKLQVLYYLGNE